MNKIAEITGYQEFKEVLRAELNHLANGFVRVGYMLKIARDTEILHESGYGSLTEFAMGEYGLGPDTVSRFIDINDRFSEGGYSENLQEKFSGYGVAKLQEMLTLPEAVVDILSPRMTRNQIREIKSEVRAEQDISEIERRLETVPETVMVLDTNIKTWIHYYYKVHPEEYVRIHRMAMADNIEGLYRELAPSGVACLTAEVPKTGRVLLSVKGLDQDIILVAVRTGETENVTWQQLTEAARYLCRDMAAEDSWEAVYGENFPRPGKLAERKRQEDRPVEKKKIAPAQDESKTRHEENPVNTEYEADLKQEVLTEDTPDSATGPENDISLQTVCESPYITERKDRLLEACRYLEKLIQEERWKQTGCTLRDMIKISEELERQSLLEEVPVQMSMEDINREEERHESEEN